MCNNGCVDVTYIGDIKNVNILKYILTLFCRKFSLYVSIKVFNFHSDRIENSIVKLQKEAKRHKTKKSTIQTSLVVEGAVFDSIVTCFIKMVTYSAVELLGKQPRRRKPRVISEILNRRPLIKTEVSVVEPWIIDR